MQGHTRGGPAGGPGFPLDDHLVVIGRQRDRLHPLNPIARFIRAAGYARETVEVDPTVPGRYTFVTEAARCRCAGRSPPR